jgi:hypothetical protein
MYSTAMVMRWRMRKVSRIWPAKVKVAILQTKVFGRVSSFTGNGVVSAVEQPFADHDSISPVFRLGFEGPGRAREPAH